MLPRIIILIFMLSFLPYGSLHSQTPLIKNDSTEIYKTIESFSKQNRFRTFIYHLIFKPVGSIPGKKKSKPKGYKKLLQKPYNNFEGKVIRKIEIVTLDPFGNSATDTTKSKQFFWSRAGNWMHIKTQSMAIKNLMLIRKNDSFSSLLVKESERLIRTQKFIHDVSFSVLYADEKTDSVDIHIRVLDKWSLIPAGSFSGSGFHAGLTDRNFMGTGHEFKNDLFHNKPVGRNSFISDYTVPNIRMSYVSANLHYEIDGDKYFDRSISIDRPFFSPVARWAGGITLASRFKRDSMEYADPLYIPGDLRFATQDTWAGFAQQIFKDITGEGFVTNLILAARFLHVGYKEKPAELFDPLQMYSNENLYLGEIGISARKYVQDTYIFKYGVVEDVPVGKVISLTGGYQIRADSKRFYLGMRVSAGNYFQWGYISSNFEYGTFFKSSHAEQGVFTGGLNYVTGLFEIGKWKFRQFVKPQVTIGINRFSYDSLTLKEGYGLDAFNSTDLSGNSRMIFTLQTQSYAPWNVFGFRFGPYLTYSLGMLGEPGTGFRNSKAYSQLGIGVLIKNENLLFSTFQISVSFYPLIPGVGQNVFKTNSYRTYDFGFRDFEVDKPSLVRFR